MPLAAPFLQPDPTVAALELAKQGRVDIRQDGIFEPIYLRAALSGDQWEQLR